MMIMVLPFVVVVSCVLTSVLGDIRMRLCSVFAEDYWFYFQLISKLSLGLLECQL